MVTTTPRHYTLVRDRGGLVLVHGPRPAPCHEGAYLVVVDGADSWFRSGDTVEVTYTEGGGLRVSGPPWTSNRSGEPVCVDFTLANGARFIAAHLRRLS